MDQIADVSEAAAEAYSLLMENDKVRVLVIRLKPGEIASMHNHPYDHVVYVISSARFRLTTPEGKVTDIDLKAGDAVWMVAESHSAENIGDTDGYNVVVEVK